MKKSLVVLFAVCMTLLCFSGGILAGSIPTISVVSANSAHNRAWVEQSKDNKAEGLLVMQLPNGSMLYNGKLKQIKCRGNSSFENTDKKSYQIKLDSSVDLNQTGNDNEKSKTWILLACSFDKSLLRNAVCFDLAQALDLKYAHNYSFVDLYYDGSYRGVYMLTEKTEVGKARVKIDDLEEEIEAANPDIKDFDDLKTVQSRTSGGTLCQYVDGIKLPDDYKGGYLLELDFHDRAKAEKTWFCTEHDLYVVVKSPEYLPYKALDYIYKQFQGFENAVFNGGKDPDTGKDFTEFVDAESLAKVYLVEELSQDFDAYLSSNFFYKPADEEKLYSGPVWDFDFSLGRDNNGNAIRPQGLGAAKTSLGSAMISCYSFRELVKKYYSEVLYEAAEEECGKIMSLSRLIGPSVVKNSTTWPKQTTGDGKAEADYISKFLAQRNEYLYSTIMAWDENPVKNGEFFDVDEKDWYYEDVKYVAEEGIFAGQNPGFFVPDGAMNRAMAVTILFRLSGEPKASAAGFIDVSEGSYYYNAVNWAYENGITVGTGNNCFSPQKSVTRQEFMTFLYHYAGEPAASGDYSSFKDAGDVSSWAQTAMKWTYGNGLIKGYDANYLRPKNTLVRSQGAAFMHRYCELMGK